MSQSPRADVPGIPLTGLAAEWADAPPSELVPILNKFGENGIGVWIVGGAVRDLMLNIKPSDIDLAVDVPPEEVMELFPYSIPTGLRFGTVTLRSSDELYEATTLRSESGYGDGRRPDEVEWGTSLRTDLSRRDFSMNAMAIDIENRLLHDPFNGRKDLENGVLRAVGDASERLSEDALRILRAYRFCDRGDAGIWWPDHNLSTALVEQAGMLANVSVERQWSEFKRIIAGKHAAMVIERMCDDGVLSILLGTGMYGSLSGVANQSKYSGGILGRVAMLFSHLDPKESELLLKRLKLSNEEVSTVSKIINSISDSKFRENNELRLFRNLYSSLLKDCISVISALSGDTSFYDLMLDMELPQTPSEPLANGDWLMERTGLPSGKRLGRLKEWMHRIQIERDIGTIEEMESILCSLPWDAGSEDEWPRLKL